MSSDQSPVQPAPVKRPRTFDEAVRQFTPSPEEVAALEGSQAPSSQGEPEVIAVSSADLAKDQELPDWVVFPEDGRFKIPVGEELVFMRFRAKWVKGSARHKGDRVCILWSLSANEEKLAIKRARGEQGLVVQELAKQCIRSVDAHTADWSGQYPNGDVNRFWDEVGPKCRPHLVNAYSRMHTMQPAELLDFLANCLVFRSAVAG